MPSIAIIPVGKDNSYNLPNKETLDKLSSVGAKIYRTDEDGSILVVSDGSNIKVETKSKIEGERNERVYKEAFK